MYVYSSCLQTCIYKKRHNNKSFKASLDFQKIKKPRVSLVNFELGTSKAGSKANKSKRQPRKLKGQGFYEFWKNRLQCKSCFESLTLQETLVALLLNLARRPHFSVS